MASGSRFSQQSSSIWPGYVDVLSALLMVVIFVLLIFTFSQFIMSHILIDQGSELDSLHDQIADITRQLGLERDKNVSLSGAVSELSEEVDSLLIDRAELEIEVKDLVRQNVADQQTIEEKLLLVASLQQDIQSLRTVRERLEKEIGTAVASLQDEKQLTKSLRDRSAVLQARLADEQEKTLLAQKNIAEQDIRIQALSALVGEQQQALDEQQELTVEARAEVALLNRKLDTLRRQLAEISSALRMSESDREAQQAEIRDLGERLNIELARQVNQLERYRSEFFGRLREIIGDNPLITVEGDRFLLQAELLFPPGSAELGAEGKSQLAQISGLLAQLIPQIPEDLPWILRVDGHTDRTPISKGRFYSNWELSTARAVSVVRFLASQGVPEQRMAATGLSKFHPLDPADTPEAYRRNRRIEIKFTSR